jgi:hypothetical protein
MFISSIVLYKLTRPLSCPGSGPGYDVVPTTQCNPQPLQLANPYNLPIDCCLPIDLFMLYKAIQTYVAV